MAVFEILLVSWGPKGEFQCRHPAQWFDPRIELRHRTCCRQSSLSWARGRRSILVLPKIGISQSHPFIQLIIGRSKHLLFSAEKCKMTSTNVFRQLLSWSWNFFDAGTFFTFGLHFRKPNSRSGAWQLNHRPHRPTRHLWNQLLQMPRSQKLSVQHLCREPKSRRSFGTTLKHTICRTKKISGRSTRTRIYWRCSTEKNQFRCWVYRSTSVPIS